MAVAVAEFQLLLAQLANELGTKIDRLVPNLDRLSQPELLSFITDAYPELVTPYISAGNNLTTVWYDEQPTKANAKPFQAEPAVVTPADQLAISARWAMLQTDPAAALKGTATRAVFSGSRDTVIENTNREGVRWARHASANACGFCRMLATRGAVYHSQALAKKSHDNCHCLAVPDRDGLYVPAPYVAQWERDYAQARKDGATTPGQIANAMDKADGGRRAQDVKTSHRIGADTDTRAPATASGTGGAKPPTPPKPPVSATGGSDIPEGWSGHVKGYRHPHGAPVWSEAERVRRQGALGVVPVGEQLFQHEIETVERIQAVGETVDWIPKDVKTFLPTNDIRWISNGGIEADLKATGGKYGPIRTLIHKAVVAARAAGVVKEHFIVDIGQDRLTDKLRGQLAKYNVRNPDNSIVGMWVVTRGVLEEISLQQ